MDMDETGVACRFHGRTFGMARFGVCRRVEPGEVGEVEWNPASRRSEVMEIWPSSEVSEVASMRLCWRRGAALVSGASGAQIPQWMGTVALRRPRAGCRFFYSRFLPRRPGHPLLVRLLTKRVLSCGGRGGSRGIVTTSPMRNWMSFAEGAPFRERARRRR